MTDLTMTTDPEGAKAIGYGAVIEWETHGHRFELMCWEYPPSGKRRLCCVTEGDLKHAGYAPLSRALAAEAEVGRLKAERSHLEEAARLLRESLDPAHDEDSSQIVRMAREQKEWLDRDQAAPPSPPVAPEPAQENQLFEGCGKCWRCLGGESTMMVLCAECGNKRCPKANDCRLACTGSNEPGQPGSAYENQASSGEAAGDGVDHVLARGWVGFINRDEVAIRTALLRYIDQQEQAEREAAGLMHALRSAVQGLTECLPEDVAQETVAELMARVELECASEWEQRMKAESDRDAERAQKEALRTELEDRNRRLVEVADERNEAHGRALDAEEKQAALRAESEGLKRLWKDCDCLPGWKALSPIGEHNPRCDMHPSNEQPTEAAPVAKAEAPSEPEIHCAFCSGTWPTVAGEKGIVAVIRGREACICENCAWKAADLATRHHAEPAPQPPATTGGEKLLGSVDALRAEIVAALRTMADAHCFSPDAANQLRAFGDELERRTK